MPRFNPSPKVENSTTEELDKEAFLHGRDPMSNLKTSMPPKDLCNKNQSTTNSFSMISLSQKRSRLPKIKTPLVSPRIWLK